MTDTEDSARTEPITFYLTEKEKEEIRREADRAGDTLSTHVARLVRKQRRQQAQEDLSEQLAPEKRLNEIVAQGKDEVKHIANHTKDVQARSAVYSIALWELQKLNYGEAQRTKALRRAARRLRKRLGDHPGFEEELEDALDAIEADGEDVEDTSERATDESTTSATEDKLDEIFKD